MSTNDTPRTDAATELYGQSPFREVAVPVAFAEEIERELAASKAEVEFWKSKAYEAERQEGLHEAEVEKLRTINADMRNFLSRAIHNEGFNEDQALKFIYQ